MNQTQKPVALKPRFENFPVVLTSRPVWVLWRYVYREGKWTKPPLMVSGDNAKSNDSATWATFDAVKAAYERGRFDGVGFMLTENSGIWGLDLDDKDRAGKWAAGGELTPAARDFVGEQNTYTELSPGGFGLRVFGFGTLPDGPRKNGDAELYNTLRFLTVTGHTLPGYSDALEERESEIAALHRKHFAEAPKPSPPPRSTPVFDQSDDELLAVAMKSVKGGKIAALYGGDITGYAGQSEADMALLYHLAFYSMGDASRLDRWFRASGLMRSKWDEKHHAGGVTYGAHHVQKAIDAKGGQFYTPKRTQSDQQGRAAGTGGSRVREPDAGGDGDGEGEAKGRGPSVATRLVQIARERFTLWHTADTTPYATIPLDGRREIWGINSTGFRDLLTRAFFAESGNAISNNAMQAALTTLGAFARLEGDKREIYTRKADLSETEGAIYLDLCNDKWQAVKVTATGWAIVDNPPVAFRRTKGALALPTPIKGGNLAELREFVNMPGEGDGGDILIIAWLLAALGPDNPYPILHLMGEQGTAKSSAARCLRALVDPAGTDLRREPKEDRDIAIAAKNGYIVAYDNVSTFPLWLSDTLCTLSTGGGLGTRKLHTDDEEALFQFKAPVLMTGIGEPSTKGDFLQRTLLVSLPLISEQGRKGEAEIKPAFEAARPRLLGALLDAVSAGLRNFAQTKLDKQPRMADFARWVASCESSCPWEQGAFLEAYAENQAAGGDTVLEADKIAPLIIRLVEQNSETPNFWRGTSTELLAALDAMLSDKDKYALPKNARALSVAVKRIASALRTQKNMEVTTLPKDRNGNRLLIIKKSEQATAQNDGANVQNDGAKLSDAPENCGVDDGADIMTAQTAQTAQKSPLFSSPNLLVKKEEVRENDGENNRGRNTPEFAPFAPLRRFAQNRPSSVPDLDFVNRAYWRTGVVIRLLDSCVVRVDNGNVAAVWVGPVQGRLKDDMSDYWKEINPFPLPAESDMARENAAPPEGEYEDDPFTESPEEW